MLVTAGRILQPANDGQDFLVGQTIGVMLVVTSAVPAVAACEDWGVDRISARRRAWATMSRHGFGARATYDSSAKRG